MNTPLYRVTMRDGREFENLTHEEVLPWISDDNRSEWAMVTPMGYGEGLDSGNAERRKAWGM